MIFTQLGMRQLNLMGKQLILPGVFHATRYEFGQKQLIPNKKIHIAKYEIDPVHSSQTHTILPFSREKV